MAWSKTTSYDLITASSYNSVLDLKSVSSSSNGWVIQKFGGTSVGKFPEDIVDNIVKVYSKNYRVAVVCSARSSNTKSEGTTSRLLKAADLASENGDFRSLLNVIKQDHVENAEQRISNKDFQNELIKATEKEISRADELLNASQIIAVQLGLKISSLPEDVVPVLTGYFGTVPGGLLNGVGRGYTDLCAALIAVGVQAEELHVWKEVDGIFTADPRKVPNARLLDSVTPEEAAELTYYGSEVIHPFTMEQVIKAKIPIRIKNVVNPKGNGTVIYPDNLGRRGEATPPHPPAAYETLPPNYLAHLKQRSATAITAKQDIVININWLLI
ncbi:hypothetical protein QCA50_012182 [Cerrena zonata]|uniref:Aspartate/glutamate/uridylate kinase domain-containing protein n=1 Tax=Cerrena zonata TaxID=2478898 RepID=A0AAW0G4H9_9APHY